MKILFAGLGSIGQRHLRNLRGLFGDGVQISAFRARRRSPVLNPDMTVRADAELESTYGVRSFATLEAALAEKPDAVFVTNPNSLHMPVALAAARQGCHLFIEKPLAHTLDGVDQLMALTEKQRLKVFVAYQFRFHPALQKIKTILEQRRLGRLVGAHIVNGEYLPAWHPYEDYRETHPARRALGGGCLNIQTHELDYALWFFGMPQSVYAVGGQLSDLEVDVEDSVSVLLRCADEGRPLPVHVHLDYLQRPPQRLCEIYGDAGKIRFDYYANVLEYSETATGQTEVHRFDSFERNQMFVDELKHFFACLRGHAEPLVDLREARRSMQIAQSAMASLEKEKVVQVDYA